MLASSAYIGHACIICSLCNSYLLFMILSINMNIDRLKLLTNDSQLTNIHSICKQHKLQGCSTVVHSIKISIFSKNKHASLKVHRYCWPITRKQYRPSCTVELLTLRYFHIHIYNIHKILSLSWFFSNILHFRKNENIGMKFKKYIFRVRCKICLCSD